VYRDHASALDEHDRAVGAILIGEALVEECRRAADRARQPDEATTHERWRAVAEVHDTHPEIWRHLDRARRVLARRGGNTSAYDELRPHAPRAATQRDDAEAAEAIDTRALDEARRAVEELKLAVPGVDWDAIDARTRGLVAAPISRRRRLHLVLGASAALLTTAIVAWAISIIPVRRPDPRAEMRRELATIRDQRKVQIVELATRLGDRCEPTLAHDLIRLMVLDGQGAEATAFGTGYVTRCGDDAVIDHWANAPRPHRR